MDPNMMRNMLMQQGNPMAGGGAGGIQQQIMNRIRQGGQGAGGSMNQNMAMPSMPVAKAGQGMGGMQPNPTGDPIMSRYANMGTVNTATGGAPVNPTGMAGPQAGPIGGGMNPQQAMMMAMMGNGMMNQNRNQQGNQMGSLLRKYGMM